jgi:hypothetical protein
MANTGQKQKSAPTIFDLLERNLPKQETEDDSESIGILEFVFWMLGISACMIFIQYLYIIFFSKLLNNPKSLTNQ